MSTLESIAVIVGVVSGVSGVALGLVNLWLRWATTRPRLVIRLAGPMRGLSTPAVCFVQVCNVGHVPVRMLRRIGFLPKRGQKGSFVISAVPEEGGRVTDELELSPQHAATLRFDMDSVPPGRKLGRAFIESVIGDKFMANRRDMRRFSQAHKATSTQPRPAAPST